MSRAHAVCALVCLGEKEKPRLRSQLASCPGGCPLLIEGWGLEDTVAAVLTSESADNHSSFPR